VTTVDEKSRDLSLKHFLKEAFVALTDVDSALVASFRWLVTKPGALTTEYLDGDRKRFLAPFRLFLICNVIYFVVAAEFGVGVLTAPLSVQTGQMTYRKATQMIVAKRLGQETFSASLQDAASRDSARRMFGVKYDGATEGVGKAIVVVLIPLYALVLQVLYAGRDRFYAEHLVFSTHLIAFLMLAIAALGTLAGLIGGMAHQLSIARGGTDEIVYSIVLILVFSAYVFQAQRIAYGASARGAAIRTVILTAIIGPMLVAFKFVLFLATLYWIR
jgi:hypothetical protein